MPGKPHILRHILDIDRKARPPIILGEGNSAEVTAMPTLKGTVGGSDQIVVSRFRNIKTSLVIELSIIKGPILNS